MNKSSSVFGHLIVIVIALAIGYGMWSLGKYISYTWMYEDMVKQTITEMVKPEAML